MKKHLLWAVCLGVSTLFAGTPKEESTAVDWVTAGKMYRANLQSDNSGVQASAAQFIRKYRITGAEDELKALLDTKYEEKVRMAASLALVSVCGEEGRTAVEKALEQEQNEIVAIFYRSVLKDAELAGR